MLEHGQKPRPPYARTSKEKGRGRVRPCMINLALAAHAARGGAFLDREVTDRTSRLGETRSESAASSESVIDNEHDD